ncbi:hypothetical protein [Pseudomonas putida]|uniref:hypothetical protein n=1 Tax=Pseudomonas putida TaxID=303 RepID=UPI003D974FBA
MFGSKESQVFDQASLNTFWSSIERQLRSESVSEQFVVELLKSGILQKDAGKAFAPLFLEAIMRSIQPLDGLSPEQLREYVDCICNEPSERWLATFTENVRLPNDGLHRYLQSELTRARARQEQKINAGELVDNGTWKLLRDVTQQTRVFIHPKSEGELNEVLSLLEDYIEVRPSPAEAKSLASRLLLAIPNTRELATWGAAESTVQKLCDAIEAFQGAERPEPKDLDEILADAEFLKANDNATAHRYFEFKSATAPATENTLSVSELISLLEEIDSKSSFYKEVNTGGPQPTGGIQGKLTYVVNALSALGGLTSSAYIDKPTALPRSVIEETDPVSPAMSLVRTGSKSTSFDPNSTSAPDSTHGPSALFTQVEQTRAEVNTFVAAQTTRNGVASDNNVSPDLASTASPATLGGTTLEQLTQSVLDVFSRIDDALTFPSASADELKGLLSQLEESSSILEVLEQFEPIGPLQVTPVSWWEPITQQLNRLLFRLSFTLVPYSLGAASTALQLIRDNPRASVTTALIAVSALYNEYRQSLQDPTDPGTALPPEVESPALHQERLENDIEQILEKPMARGEPGLSQTILKLMYQSTEHDLLDDEQLIEDVAKVLQRSSPQNPAKTYLELILETQAAEHVGHTEPVLNAHHVRKRDTAAADADVAHVEVFEQDVEPTPDIEESESHNLATLTQYLNTMDELEGAVSATDEDIDDSPSDSQTNTARHVIRLLRHRRAVTWTDASRADGDTQLINRYASALTDYAAGKVSYNAATVVVPMHSTFGHCWLNFISAIKNPFFIDWAKQANVDLSTVKVSTAHNTLTAKVQGVEKTFTLEDDSGWANVAGPILKTAGIIDPTYHGVAYPANSSIPLALVIGFHGERPAPDRSQARQRAQELETHPAFSEIKPDDPLRPLESRSEAQVEKQRQRLGDLYSYHALITSLTGLINDKTDAPPVNLNSCTLAVHKDSLFALKHPQEARRMVTAQRFISAMGLMLPITVGEVRNLIKAMSFALPESNKRADYKGALGYELPLSPTHMQTIRQTVQHFDQPVAGGLLDALLQHKSVTSPAQGLNLALNSDLGIELGNTLESNLNAITTTNSAAEWVMAALLLDLDPTPGQPRNHVAGYNLTQSANWGAKPSAVVSRLEAHLIAGRKVSATSAPVAAYHLLSAFAPEFLVRNLPDNLVCGSHTWTSFRIAVARIEQIDPGAAMLMTFEQVMTYGSTAPITAGQEIATQSASVDPLIDWAIANGNLVANTSDTYTAGQLDVAREKFNNVRAQMARALDSLTAPMPTREGLAQAELERVFGEGLPYADLCFRGKNIPHNVRASRYSLLDLYITGQLKPGIWSSYNGQIPIRTIENKLNQLKSVDSLFKETFTAYFDTLRSGSESVFKYLISQLPLEDRQSLEFGRQTFYSVRSAVDEGRYVQTPEQIEAHKGRHGILLRSEYKGKFTYYEVFPDSVEIRKNTKLPIHLKLDGELKTFRSMNDPSGYIEKQCATPQPIDWDAYEKGSVPREGITSNVIIEEIQPITQQVTFYPAGYNFDRVPDAFSPHSRVDYLAKVVVDEHFVVGRDKLESLARGSTNSENEKAFKIKISDFFASLVPFKSCIDNISQGKVGAAVFDCVLDAAGFVIPGGVAAGQAVKVAKSTGKIFPKTVEVIWITSSSLFSSANPLGGMGDLLRFGKNTVCKLGATLYRAAGLGINQIKSFYGTSKAIDHAQLLKRADIAEGAASTGLSGQTRPVTALFKDGKWYAYDATRNRPYGPPLDNFTPASSIALEPVTFSDGTTTLAPSRLFDTEPHTIRRFSGQVDVVVGHNVYRFDPTQPNTLTDITSPSHYGKLEGFDAVCSAGGKSKRGVTCLSKEIKTTKTPEQQRAQALEHKRLYPTKGTNAQVIHERRIYKFDGVVGEATAAPFVEHMRFKSETTGSIINDPHFGFPDKQIDDELEKSTRIVRVNAIIDGIDDMRDVRAFQVDIPGIIYGKYNYLVAEVDTGLFYFCPYDKKNTNNLVFTRLDYEDDGLAADLINGFHKAKDPLLEPALAIPNQRFQALPSLDTLYSNLEIKKGFSATDIEALKSKIEHFSDEKKREFVITTWNQGNILGVEVYIPEIKINITPKPSAFSGFSEANKNRFYATDAEKQIDDQLQATGLGAFNQQLPHDPLDKERVKLTQPVVLWEYERAGKPNYPEIILKTGAGNCDQMAVASAVIVISNGGVASLWRMPGAHTFTVVGIPMGTQHSTLDFSEPEYINAWIVDAWADISCPASQYMDELKAQMSSWSREGRQIISTDWKATPPIIRWMDPLDSNWIERVIDGPKETAMKKSLTP